MKIVVIGGTGLIGSKLVEKLREDGHEALGASPDTGVNTLTSDGLAEALKGAQVVVDVSNAPNWGDAAVMDFFQTSARNISSAESAAGVKHHVTLAVVGADRLPDSGYLRAKVAQEEAVKAAAVPFTILRASQFFEFIGRIADSSTDGKTVRLAPVFVQPESADDVAAALARRCSGRTAERHRRACRAVAVSPRRDRPPLPLGQRRPARGNRRRRCSVLRHRADLLLPDPRTQRTYRPDLLRGLAQAVPSVKVTTVRYDGLTHDEEFALPLRVSMCRG